MLDDRADVIRKELDEARKLARMPNRFLPTISARRSGSREPKRSRSSSKAEIEAEALADRHAQGLIESLERRSKIAEEKSRRAEIQALSEVRATASKRRLRLRRNS